MSSFLLFLLWFLISLCNAWLIMHSMEYLISLKKNRRFSRCAMFTGCLILSDMVIFIGDPINILAATLFFTIIVLISCEGSFWKKLTLGIMYVSTVLSYNVVRDNYLKPLFEILEIYIFPERQILYRQYIIEDLSLDFIRTVSAFTNFLFSLLLYISTRKSAPDKDYTLSDKLWRLMLMLTAAPFGIVLTLCTLFTSYLIPSNDWVIPVVHPHTSHYLAMPVAYLPIIFIAIFSFIILLRCIIVLARQQKLEQQSMFAEINRKYYESMEQQHFEIRRIKHDLANHLQILSALPENKRDAYLSDLTKNAAVLQSVSYCKDTTVNAVLTVKKNLMERYGIFLETAIDICIELPFDKTDICALYANALDNAIEACAKLPEDARRISLKSKAQKGLFCLEVSNPMLALPEDPFWQAMQKQSGSTRSPSKIRSHNNVIPSTSKSDKQNHGFGLKSIREIVERYHGSLELESVNGIFYLFLYIPLS